MGLNSELIAVGDYEFLCQFNLLENEYHNPKRDSLVITTIAYCVTSEQSRNLAKICGKDLQNYNEDLVTTCTEPEDPEEMFDDDNVMDIYRFVQDMLCHPQQVELYLRV